MSVKHSFLSKINPTLNKYDEIVNIGQANYVFHKLVDYQPQCITNELTVIIRRGPLSILYDNIYMNLLQHLKERLNAQTIVSNNLFLQK